MSDNTFSYYMGIVLGFFIGFIVAISVINKGQITSDHPLTPHREIKVDANGDSTITYIYKLEE